MDPLSPRPPQTSSSPQTSPVWPPPPTNAPFGQEESVNTSGRKGDVPPEIARLKWNWGAFFLPFLWSVSHRVTWGWGILVLSLLSRIPGAVGWVFALGYFAAAVYLGLKGPALGWQNRRFIDGEAQYFDVQRKWLTWGVIVTVLSVITVTLSTIGNSLPGHGLAR